MSDFSRKDEPDQNMEVRSAGQTDEIEDGLEWIEETEEAPQTDGMPEKFRSEVEITEDSGADMSGDTVLDEMEEGVLEELAEEEEPEEKENGQGNIMPTEEAILRAAGSGFTEPPRKERRAQTQAAPPEADRIREKIRPSEERAGGGDANRSRGRSRRKGSVPPESLRRAGKDIQSDEPSVRKVRGRRPGQGERRFGRRQAAVAAGAAAAVLLIGGAVYVGLGQKYRNVFFPGTEINGLDVSGKTVAEAEQMISDGISGYTLTIEERGDKTEQLSQADIGLRAEFDGTMEKIIASQNPLAWGEYVFSPASYKIKTMMAYDEEAFQKAVEGLECFDEDAPAPEDAHLSEYTEGEGYSIVPEEKGAKAVYEVVEKGISDAILNLQPSVSLEEIGGYEEPEVTSEDETLIKLCDSMNKAAGVVITYQFGDATETLSGDRIHEWLVPNADGTVGVDFGKVNAYVKELADKYNTNNKAKNLKTSYGKTVTIRGGTYGWKINQSAEADELAALIRSGQSQSGREPVYSQKAASHGANDYGDTYVEINLTAQHLFFYKNGKLLVESDFVSGNLSKGWGTPAGSYPLTYKQRDAVLKGENYRTPVDYWMPFNGGIGMHDAKWRSSFGGTIYKTGGSHGCINLPHSVAKKIYENISAGMPVLCYNLEGTEKASEPEKPKETQPSTQAPAESTAPAPTEPSTQPPAESTAPAPTEPSTQAPTQPSAQEPDGPASDDGGSGGASGPGM
ncbi:Putative peptidoglycan binding domain./L,D-transpeptidase catalytic domain [[Clostridium] cf. saccharolyticum K10]|nr:Putative peptidoglycan binding domain./L,D-transpeptidase catalytic domain [[Clostridium] cf. saccharolyticum K10]